MTRTNFTIWDLPGYPLSSRQSLVDKLASIEQSLDDQETFSVARVFVIANASAAGTNDVHALLDTTSVAIVTTGITNPTIPRSLVVVKAASWDGGTVTVHGTDQFDAVISEVFPALTDGTETGEKIFKTVTGVQHSIALDGGAGFSVGEGPKLGLPAIPSDADAYFFTCALVAEAATLDTTYGGFTPTTVPDGAVDYMLICNAPQISP